MIRLVGKFGLGVVTRVYLTDHRWAVPESSVSPALARAENTLLDAAQIAV